MLKGGSESEVRESYTHGFFHDGVKSYVARASQSVEVRLLPAFDSTVKKTSKDYKTSVAPYRDRSGPEDYYTKSPGFSSFYYAVAGFTWYGNNKLSFLSPLTGGSTNRSGACPATDIYKMCYKNEDSSLHNLTQSQGKSDPASVSRVRQFGLLNCHMTNPKTNEEENNVLIITSSCLNQLKKRLSLRAGREDPIISEDFKEFLYGDVTDPKSGSTAFIRETHIEDNPVLKFAGLFFSNKDGYLEGRQESPISDDVLSNRYDISDTEEVTNIRTYDEILEMLVADGAIPYDIIVRACDRYAENGIPSAPRGVVAVTPVLPKDKDLEEEVPMENNTIKAETPKIEPVAEESPEKDIKAVEAPQTTNLDDKQSARFSELHTKYKSDGADSLNTEELSEYFTLRIKGGVTGE